MNDRRLIMVRATLTDDEWRDLRKAAIDAGVSVAVLVGTIIRAELAERGYPQKEAAA